MAKIIETNRDKNKPNKKFRKREKRSELEEEGFEQKIVDLARVTRVMKGGKRLSFRACIAIGNKEGQVGIGVAKGSDVTISINKAVRQAKKNLITVDLVRDGTIPHEIKEKFGAAKILLKPAPKGTGIIAGGVVRIVLELAGIQNISGKILGSKSKINNVKATIKALSNLKYPAKKEKKETSKEEQEESN